jgi:hypothetical protein
MIASHKKIVTPAKSRSDASRGPIYQSVTAVFRLDMGPGSRLRLARDDDSYRDFNCRSIISNNALSPSR